MQLTQVSFTYQRTHNMGNYSNIKPTITLTADLNGDDPAQAIDQLTELAQKHIHDLIDAELERDNQPPYFYNGPLYTLRVLRKDKASRPPAWTGLFVRAGGHHGLALQVRF